MTTARIFNIEQDKITEESIYKVLAVFDQLYDKFTDIEKKMFLQSFIKQVEIYEDRQEYGRILKKISFSFPVIFDGGDPYVLSWDPKTPDETVVLMSKVCD